MKSLEYGYLDFHWQICFSMSIVGSNYQCKSNHEQEHSKHDVVGVITPEIAWRQ